MQMMTLMMNRTTVINEKTIKFSFDIFLATIIIFGLIVCILALIFSIIFNRKYSTKYWNKIFVKHKDNDVVDGGGKKQFNQQQQQQIYIVNMIYFHRRSTIDLEKTKVFIIFFIGSDQPTTTQQPPISIQITSKFFNQTNMFNEFKNDYRVIKFLLIIESEIKNVEKIAITHDYPNGELYVSMISIQNTKHSDGWISCIEQRIKSIPIDKCEQNMFLASPQSNMRLEGRFATPTSIRVLDLFSPTFLSFNLLFRECINRIGSYYMIGSISNYYIGIYAAIKWFFVVIGSIGVIYGFFYQILAGKPIQKFNYILTTISISCMIVAIHVAIKNINQFEHDNFANEIRISFMLGSAIIMFYAIPMIMLYMTITRVLFDNAK
ncbi:uncharacterized protein LOC113790457 [Dermatophagoides pteronyssinus]|uniref:uncharacterized protein LOC113790457 n=1 Tax=Dermatophagoides pteronyssinus TaxID=6956 RepID=UPI003F672376